jgi:hypothetical protein
MGSSSLDVASLAGSLSSDVMVAGGALLVITLFAFYAGSAQAVAIGLAAVLAPTVVYLAQQGAFVSGLASGEGAERIFLVCVFAVLVVLVNMMSRDILHMTSPLQAIMAGFGATCLVIMMWISTPALTEWFVFGSTVTAVFAESFRFWWLMAVFGLFAFSRM